MQINFDPTRFMVALTGFVVDWTLTREWRRILLNSIPLFFLALVGVLVFWGSRLDKHQLATRYLELGEKEIADWEQSWAPAKPAEGAAKKEENDKETSTEQPEKKELSRFAEVLFRRVQLLEPNERSQFVIGVTMAQRGATTQAEKMLSKIAPDNRPGYAPAHAWIAQNLFRKPITPDNVNIVKHHVTEAVKWERVPESLLLVGSELFMRLNDRDSCLELLKRAAEVNPANSLFLFQRSKQLENPVLAENSAVQAEAYFRQELQRDPNDLRARLGMIQTLAEAGKLNEAEEVVRAGMQIEQSPELTRGLSEVYRLRYLTSLKQEGDRWTGDLQMLDTAMRTDPSNPMVGEEIAKLARLNGESPGDELILKLQQFLAEGKATAATHAWISELYLIRKNYAQALPYLEQVVARLPNSAQYANNLAYVLDEIAPERRQEALALAQRAVQIEPRSADYFDTLAKVLAGLERRTEAITALQSAIERQPNRIDFHEGIRKLYEATGNLQMAEQHRTIAVRLAEEQAKMEAAKAASVSGTSTPLATDTKATDIQAADEKKDVGTEPEAGKSEADVPEVPVPEASLP